MRSMQTSQTMHERAKQVIPGPHSNLPGYEKFKPIFITRGKGMHLWDVDGNEFLDYMSGLGAGVLGYGNQELNAAKASWMICITWTRPAITSGDRTGRENRPAHPVRGEGALPALGHRGRPAGDPPGARLHRQKPVPALRRTLPRLAGQRAGRQRQHGPGRPALRLRQKRGHVPHRGPRPAFAPAVVQDPLERSRFLRARDRRSTASRSRWSSWSRSTATAARAGRSPATWSGCASYATATALCSALMRSSPAFAWG